MLFKKLGARFVMCAPPVITLSIELDCQSLAGTIEVKHKWPNRMLATKL